MNREIDADLFLRVVMPGLKAGDAAALARHVRARWVPAQLCPMLQHDDADVRRVAAVTLGLIGDCSVVPCLVGALRDDDAQVNEMAEHSLWAIWFRGGRDEASRPFKEGVALLADEQFRPALRCFEHALAVDPNFAEAYNQCAIAQFFMSRYKHSLLACSRAVKLQPAHFGAIAQMGHCYTQMDDLPRALRCYRQALRINPGMPAVANALERLERRFRDVNDESGEHPIQSAAG
jgi:tetratricopeptide (TPR) repeat protein